MDKKRIIVEVNEADHHRLTEEAHAAGKSLANLVREALELPSERQGVKGTLSAEVRSKKERKPAAKGK